jgi:4-hydroxy-tetrahydrodipicolinate reductase
LINIAVPGLNGRMSTAIRDQISQDDDLKLVGIDSNPDVLIDFTAPEGVVEHLDYCLQHNIAMIIGVTGFSEEQFKLIEQSATRIPIVLSANMSMGVNICYKLLAQAAKLFDSSWSVKISDVHHQHKKDSPSGTAKHMARVIAAERDIDISSIEITSERRGEVVGEHTVVFTSTNETVTINHTANTRDIFATGAINAARWIYGKKPGFYTMNDIIST